MLRRILSPRIEPLLNRVAGFCALRKITPNQLTLFGFLLSLVAGLTYMAGLFSLGAILLLIGSLGDLLDGALARSTRTASRFGAFLDSTMDRYSDFFVFAGIAYYFATEGLWGFCLMALWIILGAFITSYAKARAESLIPSCEGGVLERAERLILLILGSFFQPLLPWVLVILLIGTHATAVQRILFVKKALEAPPSSN